MSQTVRSVSESYKITRRSCEIQESGHVIQPDPYVWVGVAPKSAPGAIGIDDLIAEFAHIPEFAAGLQEGRQWIASTAYPQERSLRVLRLEQGLSQKDLADRTGTQQPYIARIETGKTDPGLRTVKKIADALGVAVGELCEIVADEDR